MFADCVCGTTQRSFLGTFDIHLDIRRHEITDRSIQGGAVDLIRSRLGNARSRRPSTFESDFARGAADENSDDPFLVAMAERAKAVLEGFEDRQTSTEEALNELLAEIARDEQRKQEQAAKGLDGLTYFVLCKLEEEKIANAEAVSQKVREAFAAFPNWRSSEREQRELRTRMTFAIFAEEDSEEKVAVLVEAVLSVLTKVHSK